MTTMMMKRQSEMKRERACKKQRAFGVASRNGYFDIGAEQDSHTM
ncbi:hypothetical protein [Clostridium porci]|nr:hypothetical protein [Clostridium porci]